MILHCIYLEVFDDLPMQRLTFWYSNPIKYDEKALLKAVSEQPVSVGIDARFGYGIHDLSLL